MPITANASGIRVLHFGRFHDEHFGGIERHVGLLLAGLARAGAAPCNLVAANSLDGDVLAGDGYAIHRAPCFGRLAGMAVSPAMFVWAHRLHRQHQFDVVHLHFPDPLSQFVAQTLPRHVARVVSWHSDIVRQKKLLVAYRPLLDRFLGKVDAVVAATPNHFRYSEQMERVAAARRHVVPYGLDYRAYENPEAARRGSELRRRWPGRTIVFALGRHVYYKGFDTLIEAVAAVPDAQLILGGQGPLTDELRRLAARLAPGRVDLVGRIPEAELAAYYHASDVFCLPSPERSEAFGIVQLEAMACGKPVVSCDLPSGVPFVNRHEVTGLIVPPRDPVALAVALAALAESPAWRRQLGDNGRRHARDSYSIDGMVRGTLDVYRQAMQAAAERGGLNKSPVVG